MNNINKNPAKNIKFIPVDASGLESIGYAITSRQLYIKFHNNLPTLCFDNVPGFRYEGLLAAPRKDAYYKTFIENQFMASQVKIA
jgi:KTSC domain